MRWFVGKCVQCKYTIAEKYKRGMRLYRAVEGLCDLQEHRDECMKYDQTHFRRETSKDWIIT